MRDIQPADDDSTMHRHLLCLDKICLETCDRTDYENFATAASLFLEQHNDHEIYVKTALRAATTFRKPHLVKVAFHVLSKLRIKIEVLERCMRYEQHSKFHITREDLLYNLRNSSTLSFILPFCLAQKITLFDKKIAKILCKKNVIFDANVFDYISGRPEIAKKLMNKISDELLRKQLAVISICKVVYNIDRFIPLMGSYSKMLSFAAFEAFCSVCLVWDAANNAPSVIRPLKKTAVTVDSPLRFFTYAFNFIEERDEILNLYKRKDYGKIAETFAFYCNPILTTNEIESAKLCAAKQRLPVPTEFSATQDFSFLFHKEGKRQPCDCLEL